MAKSDKKAELDKDGINLSENKEDKDKKGKVELDQDGLNIKGKDKVDLDKDGLLLSKSKKKTSEGNAAGSPDDVAEGAQPGSRRKLIIIGSVAAGVVLLLSISLGGFFWYKANAKQKLSHAAPIAKMAPVRVATIVNESEVLLDPFMILYTPQTQSKSGVLVAQVSLQVNPKTAANVRDRLYEIRTIINENLSKNALVYTQFEIGEMLKEKLRAFEVADITFTKFDLR